MGNIVKVSRAPRVRKVKFQEVKKGEFYLRDYRPDMYVLCEKDSPARRVHTSFSLPYDIELGENEVIPFESFEAMCKWGAGGRKLEDLQGDAKDEWIPATDMKAGDIAEVVNNTGVVQCIDYSNDSLRPRLMWVSLAGPEQWAEKNFSVWPLGPGDSITIEPEKP